jgi:uncharacterized protein (TIGR02285 family)
MFHQRLSAIALGFLAPLVVGHCIASGAAAEDRLTWIVIGTDGAGERAPQDAAADWLMAHLSGFEHHKLHANIPRALALAKDADGYCIPELRHNDTRAEILTFSHVMGWSVADRLFVRRGALPLFARHRDAEGRIKLQSLMADGHLKGAREAAATLGAKLEAVLRGGPIETVPRFDHAIRMLAAARFDWLIADPAKAQGLIAGQSDRDAVVTLPIAEDSDLKALYVACSKGPVGRKAVDAVNAMLDTSTASPLWEQVYVDALDAESRREYDRLRGSR